MSEPLTGPSTTEEDRPTPIVEEPPEERWRLTWPPMSYWARVTVTVVAILTVIAALAAVGNIVILIVIAAVLAIGLDPAVRYFERRGSSRGAAVSLIFLGVLAFIVLFASLVVPALVRQVGELADNIPAYVDQLGQREDALGRYFRETNVAEKLKDFVADLPKKITSSFGTIVGVAGKVTSAIFNLITVAILTIYFMLSLPRMRKSATLVFPKDSRERGEIVLDRSIDRIGGYVAGNLTTSLICGFAALIFFLVLGIVQVGIPYAVPLAIWAGIADLIPAVGAYIGAAPAVIVGFFAGPVTGLLILMYFLAYQQFENYYIVPRVMRNAVNLSSAAVIISTLVFGSLFGFAGALLALPAAATIKVVLMEVFLRDRSEEGDVAARDALREAERAEADAQAEARARAATRQRFLRRLRDRMMPGKDDDDSTGA
jgi:predicted PurR-regulated permease PerM